MLTYLIPDKMMSNSSPESAVCPFCYPEVVNHRQEKLNSFLLAYMSKPFSYLSKALTFNKPLYFTDRYLVATIILLRKLNKVQTQQDLNPKQASTAVQLLWAEGRKRGLYLYSFTLYNRQLMSFLLTYNKKNYYFHYSPTTLLHKNFKKYSDPTIYDDKYHFKKTLIANNLPYPEGKLFFSKTKAFQYGIALGFPLVVKPAASTFSHHVSLNINDVDALINAIEVVKLIDCRIVVERYIQGSAHRMMCGGDKFIVCSKRTPATLVGDGTSSISSLIDVFNSNPLRGNIHDSGYALYQVRKEAQLLHYLQNQGLSLDSVLDKGKKIYLSEKSNCSNGAEVINLTEQVCAENIELFHKLHNALGIGVSAVDFICIDVSQPWHSQPFAFLENNSFPAIDPQHYPSQGLPVDVAKEIWGLVLSELETRD